jgi:RNA polymerase sigma-70 factor (ECF subfamily)
MLPDFRELYEQHVRFVWRVISRLGVPASDVGDAVQDVFVVVHRKLPEFEGRSKASTWIFAICMRVAAHRRRAASARREVPLSVEPVFEPAGDGGATPLERGQAQAILDTILDKMSDEQRVVFVLFELEQMSAAQIAELLDIPIGTVRSRLRLARAAFEQAIARLRATERRLALTFRAVEGWR